MVRKTKGSQWHGKVVGTYSTELTPEGYAVESWSEKGSVQIYPAAALELAQAAQAQGDAAARQAGAHAADRVLAEMMAESPPAPSLLPAEIKSGKRLHVLKTWPDYFSKVTSGDKTFECRVWDRDYRVGDHLYLYEWDPKTANMTGRSIYFRIGYILTGPCSPVGFCVMTLAPVVALPAPGALAGLVEKWRKRVCADTGYYQAVEDLSSELEAVLRNG